MTRSAAQPERPDHARELRYALCEPRLLCERLGLLGRGTYLRQTAGGFLVRCPWHDDRTPSCSVRVGPDGTTQVRCHGCGATGDALSLIAQVRGLSTRRQFRDVLLEAADIAGRHDIAGEILDGSRARAPERAPVPPPRLEPEPDRDYPPAADIAEVWSLATAVSADAEAAAWATDRGLDPEALDAADLARVIPQAARLPRWASYRRRAWTETGHRLIVPMRDPMGVVRSVRGCRIREGDTPKRLPPGGHKAGGLVMACAFGAAMLEGTFEATLAVVVEGEPDYFTWATRPVPAPVATVGIVGGSWTQSFVDRFTFMAMVIVRTDHDAAGDAYAAEVMSALRGRCFVRRGGKAA